MENESLEDNAELKNVYLTTNLDTSCHCLKKRTHRKRNNTSPMLMLLRVTEAILSTIFAQEE